MMNRQNYEAWFLDFLEGNLSEKQIRVLTQFLAKNPDLKAELDEMELFVLPIDTNVVFPEKDLLKKTAAKQLSIDHLDNLLIGQLENTLSTKEANELKQALLQNPKFQKDQKLYQLTILKPDLKVKHPDKDQLKRKDRKIIPIRYFVQAAAMILLLIGAFFAFNQQEKTPPVIVHTPDTNMEAPKKAVDNIQEVPEGIEDQIVESQTNTTVHSNHIQNTTKQVKTFKQSPKIRPTKEKTILVSTPPIKKPEIIEQTSKKELANQVVKPDTIFNKHPTRKPSTPVNKGVLANNKPTPKQETNINKAPSTQSKSLALTAIDYGLTKVSKEKQDHNSIGNALVSSAEILTNNKVKIKKEETTKRKRFSISVGRFGFSRSKSRG